MENYLLYATGGLFLLFLLFLSLYISEKRKSLALKMEEERFRRMKEDAKKSMKNLRKELEERERLLIALPDYLSRLITLRSEDKIKHLFERTLSSILDIEWFETYWWNDAKRKMEPEPHERNHDFVHAVLRDGIPMTREEFLYRATSTSSPDLSLCVPLRAFGRSYGVVCVKETKDLEEKRRFLLLLAQLTASAVDNLYLFKKIEEIANMDPLTHLKNRGYFFHEFERMLEKAKRRIQSLSLLIFDIDHFKKFNDTFGHPAGDEILKRFARVLKEHFTNGLTARYGGEEFVVVLPGVDKEGAYKLAEGLRKHMEEKEKVTVSGGVACYPEDGRDVEEMLKKADDALYKAKKEGRNRIKKA